MRLVVDTNVLFSALYDPASTCGQILFLAIEGELTLIAPETVRDEIDRTLQKKLGYAPAEAAATILALPVDWIEQVEYASRLEEAREAIGLVPQNKAETTRPAGRVGIRDPSDAALVALALAKGADIVSGDKGFHPLKKNVVKTWKPRDVGKKKKA